MSKNKVCCICGKEFTEWGNNPRPIKDDGVCCDHCNMLVIEKRLEIIRKQKQKEVE